MKTKEEKEYRKPIDITKELHILRDTVLNYNRHELKYVATSSRLRTYLQTRHECFYLSKEIYGNNIPLRIIGEIFEHNIFDHATVIHGCKAIKDLLETNKDVCYKMKLLEESCNIAIDEFVKCSVRGKSEKEMVYELFKKFMLRKKRYKSYYQ